jgi:hypothetical protein
MPLDRLEIIDRKLRIDDRRRAEMGCRPAVINCRAATIPRKLRINDRRRVETHRSAPTIHCIAKTLDYRRAIKGFYYDEDHLSPATLGCRARTLYRKPAKKVLAMMKEPVTRLRRSLAGQRGKGRAQSMDHRLPGGWHNHAQPLACASPGA